MHSSLQPYMDRVQLGLLSFKTKSDLVLFNYTEKCTYERAWDEYTRAARGIVFNTVTGEKVAHCLEKFFNINEADETRIENLLSKKIRRVSDKVDGSCAIIYFHDGDWQVNTRGSFNSEQAIEAKKMLAMYDMGLVSTEITLIAEIVYPENKIIVNYGQARELVLLTAFVTKTGQEIYEILPFLRTRMRIAPESLPTLAEMLQAQKTLSKDIEGFVVVFDDGLRVKIKGDEYMKVARLISGMSPICLWENMKDGKVNVKLLEALPEEFRKEYEKVRDKLEAAYKKVSYDIKLDIGQLPYGERDVKKMTPERRKEIGMFIKNSELRHGSALFQVLSGNADKYIMKCIYPKGNVI